MNKEDLEGNAPISYPLIEDQQVLFSN